MSKEQSTASRFYHFAETFQEQARQIASGTTLTATAKAIAEGRELEEAAGMALAEAALAGCFPKIPKLESLARWHRGDDVEHALGVPHFQCPFNMLGDAGMLLSARYAAVPSVDYARIYRDTTDGPTEEGETKWRAEAALAKHRRAQTCRLVATLLGSPSEPSPIGLVVVGTTSTQRAVDMHQRSGYPIGDVVSAFALGATRFATYRKKAGVPSVGRGGKSGRVSHTDVQKIQQAILDSGANVKTKERAKNVLGRLKPPL